ncbi:MAG: hypothetical protein OEV73_11170 [Desulfobulbaceae bacterium]|nr:hypothetical protein [Desulfobulbaceae bacterium]
MQLAPTEKTRRMIGAILLCLGALAILWADHSRNPALLQGGKAAAAFGIILYFLGRIGRLLRKER